MKIAIAQMNTKPGDLEATVERMVAQTGLAQGRGADLVVFPTPALTGPNPAGITSSAEFLSDLTSQIERLGREAACPCLVPFAIDNGDGITYEAALVRDGQALPLRLASYLAAVAVTTEPEEDVESSESVPVGFELAGVRFGIAFDAMGLSDFADAGSDVDAIILMPNACFDTDDEATALAPSVSDGCFVHEAAEANAWLVAAGAVGGYDDQVFTGGSFVMAPWGELAAVAASFEEDLVTAEIDPISEGPLARPATPPEYSRMQHLWDALALATRDFVTKQGIGNVVVTLTGDLISSAVATLAVDALGPTKVHALMLPSHDEEGTAEDARQLARNLRIGYEDVLTGEVGLAARKLASLITAPGEDYASSTLLHRDLASALLARRARELNACVLSAQDKTSAAVDCRISVCRCASLAPLGDVYRSDVAALVRQRNTVSPVVPVTAAEHVSAPAGLGLEELGGTVESQISELDAILLMHVERGMGLSAIVSEGFDEGLVSRVLDRVQACELGRQQIPLCPIVSERTFVDRAWPLSLAWHDHVREDDPSGDPDKLRADLERLVRSSLGAQGASVDAARVENVLEMLHDLAQGDRAHGEGDDIWNPGLFSDN